MKVEPDGRHNQPNHILPHFHRLATYRLAQQWQVALQPRALIPWKPRVPSKPFGRCARDVPHACLRARVVVQVMHRVTPRRLDGSQPQRAQERSVTRRMHQDPLERLLLKGVREAVGAWVEAPPRAQHLTGGRAAVHHEEASVRPKRVGGIPREEELRAGWRCALRIV